MTVAARKGEDRSRTCAVRPHGPNPEVARQRGEIRPRSRSQLGFPG
jgi:hypothetical protein